MINDFNEDCIDTVFDSKKRILNVSFKFAKFFNHFSFGLIDWSFNFSGVNIHWCELLKILFGLIDDNFQGFDFMPLMTFIITNAANDAVFNTFWFETYKIQYLSKYNKMLLIQHDRHLYHIQDIWTVLLELSQPLFTK